MKVTGYKQPAIEGTVITLSCPDGLILTGPTMYTCMGNGEWEPDPREVECKGMYTSVHLSEHSFKLYYVVDL